MLPSSVGRVFKGVRRGEKGQVLVEFALVSLIFFMLVFAILDFARLFESWVAVQHASRAGARYAVTGQVICDGYTDNRKACIVLKAKGGTTGLTGGGESGADVSVTCSSWQYPTYADPPATASGCSTAVSTGDQCDAIEVKVSYTHHFVTPILEGLLPSGVPLIGRQRMINEPFGPCT